MDKKQIEPKLAVFRLACEKEGYPLVDLCLEETYPGVIGTSYTLLVKALWANDLCCSDALDILVPIFFNSTDVEVRRHVTGIKVTDIDEVLECFDTMTKRDSPVKV